MNYHWTRKKKVHATTKESDGLNKYLVSHRSYIVYNFYKNQTIILSISVYIRRNCISYIKINSLMHVLFYNLYFIFLVFNSSFIFRKYEEIWILQRNLQLIVLRVGLEVHPSKCYICLCVSHQHRNWKKKRRSCNVCRHIYLPSMYQQWVRCYFLHVIDRSNTLVTFFYYHHIRIYIHTFYLFTIGL